jgi:hypothetical protein
MFFRCLLQKRYRLPFRGSPCISSLTRTARLLMAFLISVFPGLRNIRICEKSGNMGEPHKIKKKRNLFIPDSYRNLDAGVFGPDIDTCFLPVIRSSFRWRNFNKRSLFIRLRFILLFPPVQGIRMQVILFAVFSAGNFALQVSLY